MNSSRVDRRVPASSFVGCRFPPVVILLAVLWYLRYGISLLAESVAERRNRERELRALRTSGVLIHTVARCVATREQRRS